MYFTRDSCLEYMKHWNSTKTTTTKTSPEVFSKISTQ
jgi:hypothetical protein